MTALVAHQTSDSAQVSTRAASREIVVPSAFPVWKRALDLIVGTPVLIGALPVFAAVRLAMIVTGDAGPLFFRATRVGEGGRPFRIVKLRSMRPNATGPAVTTSSDHRITTLGRLLRRTKVDELPQLWNVVRGDMTLVGPRPEDPRFVDWSDPLHRIVFRARPGVTGLAQIAYRREEHLVPATDLEAVYIRTVLPAKLALDAEYLRRRSLGVDIRILAQTLRAVAS